MANSGGLLGLDPQWPLLKSTLAESIRSDERNEASGSDNINNVEGPPAHREFGDDLMNSRSQLLDPPAYSQSLIIRTDLILSGNSVSKSMSTGTSGTDSSSNVAESYSTSPTRAPTVTHAGDVTHTDWMMEEITTALKGTRGDSDLRNAAVNFHSDTDKMELETVNGDSERTSVRDTESEPSTDDSIS
jgi:hypothetical protein